MTFKTILLASIIAAGLCTTTTVKAEYLALAQQVVDTTPAGKCKEMGQKMIDDKSTIWGHSERDDASIVRKFIDTCTRTQTEQKKSAAPKSTPDTFETVDTFGDCDTHSGWRSYCPGIRQKMIKWQEALDDHYRCLLTLPLSSLKIQFLTDQKQQLPPRLQPNHEFTPLSESEITMGVNWWKSEMQNLSRPCEPQKDLVISLGETDFTDMILPQQVMNAMDGKIRCNPTGCEMQMDDGKWQTTKTPLDNLQ